MLKKKKRLNINSKKILKIIMGVLLILFILSAIMTVQATDVTEGLENSPNVGETVNTVLTGFLNGLLGIIFWLPAAVGGLIVIVMYLVVALVFFLVGNESFFITPADIFYNRIPLLSIDFFDFSTGGSDVMAIRASVARWFVTLSGLAAALLLAVLIYIAIRSVLASTGEAKAKLYKMFVNWVISLGLLAVLGVIIVGAITLNNAFVNIIRNTSEVVMEGNDLTSIIGTLMWHTVRPFNFIGQLSAIILLAVLTLQIFQYAAVYVKRMLKIAFLIMIAPLVTITYSIDKIADNKSQALNTWMHVFLFNVFIQTFHALVFSVFFVLSINILSAKVGSWDIFGTFSSNIPGTILAIMSLRFIGDAEKIIRQIFAINDGASLQEGSTIAKLAVAQRVMDFTKKRLSKADESGEQKRTFKGSMRDGASPRVGGGAGGTVPVIAGGSQSSGTSQTTGPTQGSRTSQTQGAPSGQSALDTNLQGILAQEEKKDGDALDKTSRVKRMFQSAKRINSKDLIKNAATIAGGTYAIASGNAISAMGIAVSARNVGELVSKQRENRQKLRKERGGLSRRGLYVQNTKDAAQEGLKTFGMNQLVNGESPDINTQDQIDQMQSWFRMIEDKGSTDQLLNEYKYGKMELIRKLQQSRGITRAKATAMTHQLENMILEGSVPREGSELSEAFNTMEGRNFASVALERKQYNDMEQYNDLESGIRGVSYDYSNVRNVLNDQDLINEMEGVQVQRVASLPEQPEVVTTETTETTETVDSNIEETQVDATTTETEDKDKEDKDKDKGKKDKKDKRTKSEKKKDFVEAQSGDPTDFAVDSTIKVPGQEQTSTTEQSSDATTKQGTRSDRTVDELKKEIEIRKEETKALGDENTYLERQYGEMQKNLQQAGKEENFKKANRFIGAVQRMEEELSENRKTLARKEIQIDNMEAELKEKKKELTEEQRQKKPEKTTRQKPKARPTTDETSTATTDKSKDKKGPANKSDNDTTSKPDPDKK